MINAIASPPKSYASSPPVGQNKPPHFPLSINKDHIDVIHHEFLISISVSPLTRIRSRLSNSLSAFGRIERLLLNIIVIRRIRYPFSMMSYSYMLLRHPLIALRPSTADLFLVDNITMPSCSAFIHTLSILR